MTRPPLRCFQGVVPATLVTVSRAGEPNVTYLSQVFRIDDDFVALSCQFFNKTKANVLEHPFACAHLLDPVTLESYRLELEYVREERSGPLFDTMRLRIDAIASHTGMAGVFKLLSADVYRVLSCTKVEGFIDPPGDEAEPEPPSVGPRSELKALQLVSQRTCRARDLDELVGAVLETLDEGLGFRHSMLLLLDETETRLFTVASRGYGAESVGAEVAVGEGLIGAVAKERRLLRFSGVDAELRYGRAVRASAQRAGGGRAVAPEVPLPGLVDAMSHMAMPLVVGDRLLGVLAVESPDRLSFDEWDEAFVEIVVNQVAVALDGMLSRSTDEDIGAPAIVERRATPVPVRPGDPLRFRFYANDDCVFFDGEYLIRNVPGKILWKILRELSQGGRTEFTNRELRLDGSLGLPQVRDNLESRLVLLRKRLEEKCPDLQIVRTARGRFRVEARRPVVLEEVDGA